VDSLDFLVYTALTINLFSHALLKKMYVTFFGGSLKDKFKIFGAVSAQFETFLLFVQNGQL
jgi:hypothetical protein